jgi:hypothetical protein
MECVHAAAGTGRCGSDSVAANSSAGALPRGDAGGDAEGDDVAALDDDESPFEAAAESALEGVAGGGSRAAQIGEGMVPSALHSTLNLRKGLSKSVVSPEMSSSDPSLFRSEASMRYEAQAPVSSMSSRSKRSIGIWGGTEGAG